MKVKTFMSTDWIEVHDHDSVYEAKIFLTDDGKAYMIMIQNDRKKFFKVDANLLKSGELKFFEKVMTSAEELPVKKAADIGLIKGQ